MTTATLPRFAGAQEGPTVRRSLGLDRPDVLAAAEADDVRRRLDDALDGGAPPCSLAPEWWHPETREEAEVAEELCRSECWVLRQCAELASALGARDGVWAGELRSADRGHPGRLLSRQAINRIKARQEFAETVARIDTQECRDELPRR